MRDEEDLGTEAPQAELGLGQNSSWDLGTWSTTCNGAAAAQGRAEPRDMQGNCSKNSRKGEFCATEVAVQWKCLNISVNHPLQLPKDSSEGLQTHT